MLTFKQYISEGNPLARTKAFADTGRHFVGLSAERSGLSKEDNESRVHELKGKIKALGYGFRQAKGMWEGGEESSVIVYAKGTGHGHGRRLVRDASKLAKHYDQDSIFHHDGKEGKLIGTNKTGFPGFGKKEPVGTLAFNRKDAPFQTAFKPAKPKDQRPKFTTTTE